MRRIIHSTRQAFTLVELLVVIGIIALLISILLPALSKARQAGQTVKCLAQLRGIVQAMQTYAAANKGAILGSPCTTGAFLLDPNTYQGSSNYSDTNTPGIISIWDWMSPVATEMGITFDDAPADKAQRYLQLASNKAFLCPNNDILVVPYTGTSGFSTAPMTSYCTATLFLQQSNPGTLYYGTKFPKAAYYNPPTGYGPNLGSIQRPAAKVFMSEGGGWSNGTKTPDVDLGYADSAASTSFTDTGPWDTFARCLLRSMAPGNAGGLTMDPRVYAFRHGKLIPGGAADTFRFNVAFYDGHCETMGDLQGSDPSMWAPTGSFISQEFQNDVKTQFAVSNPFYAN